MNHSTIAVAIAMLLLGLFAGALANQGEPIVVVEVEHICLP